MLFGCCSSTWAQTPKESSDLIRELLSAPAPPPRSAETSLETKRVRPRKFFDRKNVPPDDAPVEDLVEYWSYWASRPDKPAPSNTVRQRLLDASVDDLEKLSELLPLFPSAENFAEKIRQAFDKGEGDPQLNQYRQKIKKWLLFNSKYFIGELLSLANKVKDDDNGYIENERALVALAKFDWSMPKPLLETLVNSGQQRSSTLALTLFYQHTLDEKDVDAELKFRSKLQSIASNRSLPGRARDAWQTLLAVHWRSGPILGRYT